ncbi:MAG: RHS repeat-associated core domain-containing protein [Candidatus Acidiferrum sp.]
MNRLTQKTYPDTTTVNYTYDNDSRLTQVTDPTGTYQFTFDNMGRLTQAVSQYSFLTGRNFTTAYTYDKASNRTGFTDPENGSTSYAYDTLNRLQTLTPPTAFSGSGSFGFSYDALSRRTQMTRPNSITTNYSYDNLSRLLSVLHQSGSTTLDGASYTVDNAGNRTAKTDQYANVTSNYTYDPIYELTQVTQATNTTESYTFDAVGNRLSSLGVPSYTNNSSNELTSTPSTTYTYDANGNAATDVNSSGTTTFAWDFENRLSSVTLPGTGGTVSFKYDPFGRRIEKVSPTTTSIFAYDGDNLIEEANSAGTVVARYSQGLNIDEPLAMLRSSTTSYYDADGLGSITSLSSSAGSLAQTYGYDSFGKQTSSSGSLTNPFQYTARESDTETGLYYYRARYYDPTIGRFVREDPIRFRTGIDFYSYVRNRPTGLRDPKGRVAWGGGAYVSGMAGLLTIGGGAEGSCMIVGDTAGNTGLLCCAGLGGGYVAGGAASGGVTTAICPTCATICDMEGGSVQGEGFGATGPGVAAGGGASVDMKNATIFANAGPAAGEGGGVVLLATSCKLIIGGKRCKNCPLSKK